VLDYPQSGEQIRDRHNIQESRFVQPNKKRFTVRRITGSGDLWVTEFTLSYDDVPSYAVSIMEFREGFVAHETQYFADRFEPAPRGLSSNRHHPVQCSPLRAVWPLQSRSLRSRPAHASRRVDKADTAIAKPARKIGPKGHLLGCRHDQRTSRAELLNLARQIIDGVRSEHHASRRTFENERLHGASLIGPSPARAAGAASAARLSYRTGDYENHSR
jgi:hypothetical protein